MNRNLDVWAIQKYPNELYTALENVKTDKGDLILFRPDVVLRKECE